MLIAESNARIKLITQTRVALTPKPALPVFAEWAPGRLRKVA